MRWLFALAALVAAKIKILTPERESTLRQFEKPSHASKPYLGIGNPLLDGAQGDPTWGADDKKRADVARTKRCSQTPSVQGVVVRGRRVLHGFAFMFRGTLADIEDVRSWTPLPETADELCEVERRLGVPDSEVLLGGRCHRGAGEGSVRAGPPCRLRDCAFCHARRAQRPDRRLG
jgi:hypothetical protein